MRFRFGKVDNKTYRELISFIFDELKTSDERIREIFTKFKSEHAFKAYNEIPNELGEV